MRELFNALQLSEARVVEVFALGGAKVTAEEAEVLCQTADNGQSTRGSEGWLRQFLDGLIVAKRGPRAEGKAAVEHVHLNQNEVLKKLRIAWTLKEDEVLATLEAGGCKLGKRELGALFRKRGNKHYRVAGDDVVFGFIAGLGARVEAGDLPGV